MWAEHNETLCTFLRERGLVPEDALREATGACAEAGGSLLERLGEGGFLSSDEVLVELAAWLGLDRVAPVPAAVSPELAAAVPPELARRHGVVPYESVGTSLRVLAVDPLHFEGADQLAFSLGREVELLMADPGEVERLVAATYGDEGSPFDALLQEIGPAQLSAGGGGEDPEELARSAPLVGLVDAVLAQAIRRRASDIHFEPFEDEFRIRYRIDGTLHEMAPPPRRLAAPMISRLKVLAHLNIAERRVPQDGRIKKTVAGSPVDLRVSTLPTRQGESCVLRVLDRSAVPLDLEALGLPSVVLGGIRQLVRQPHGIFLATGPTGSGKTTTLYSALREGNAVGRKLLTVEDPVEYEIDGILQTTVNHAIGLDFARALRTFLRQDPDQIMVGEIRDLETARIAVQASLTGHLVLSTLHTNDAPDTVLRLVDMGLEPYLIAASLEAVLAQRLVRRVCRSCRRLYEPDPELLAQLGLTAAETGGRPFACGTGCRECSGTGFRGRTGLFEWMKISDRLREAITGGASRAELRERAREEGMRTLREDGVRALLEGVTAVEEVLQAT
jgi:type IV pilus assembly protein PilB